MDPYPGQYSTASSRPCLITTGHPVRGPRLLAILQGQAADILQSVPAEAAYEDVRTLEDHYRHHQLAAAYRSDLKARTQLNDES